MGLNSIVSSNPNSVQVGGTHYQDQSGSCPHCGGTIQHWDLYGRMPYIVGYTCRYIMRFKDGWKDLLKAHHCLTKLMSLFYPAEYAEWKVEQELAHPAAKTAAEWRQYAANIERSLNMQPFASNDAIASPPPLTFNQHDAVCETDGEGHILSILVNGRKFIAEDSMVQPPAAETIMRQEWGNSRSQTGLIPDEAQLVRQRADAYAQDNYRDVPVGWTLEEVHGRPGKWHYRDTHAGAQWSEEFGSRAHALRHLCDQLTIDAMNQNAVSR